MSRVVALGGLAAPYGSHRRPGTARQAGHRRRRGRRGSGRANEPSAAMAWRCSAQLEQRHRCLAQLEQRHRCLSQREQRHRRSARPAQRRRCLSQREQRHRCLSQLSPAVFTTWVRASGGSRARGTDQRFDAARADAGDRAGQHRPDRDHDRHFEQVANGTIGGDGELRQEHAASVAGARLRYGHRLHVVARG